MYALYNLFHLIAFCSLLIHSIAQIHSHFFDSFHFTLQDDMEEKTSSARKKEIRAYRDMARSMGKVYKKSRPRARNFNS